MWDTISVTICDTPDRSHMRAVGVEGVGTDWTGVGSGEGEVRVERGVAMSTEPPWVVPMMGEPS